MSCNKKTGFNDTQKQNGDTFNTAQENKKLPNWFPRNTIRRILKTRSECNCCSCLDSGIRYDYEIDYELLQEEIKSTQKSIAHCKEDTNKILSKVQRLEAYFQ